MTRRPEYVEAIRALGGSTGDPTPVIRLLRDPSGLPHADWQELVALIAELLSTDEKLRQLAEVSGAGGKPCQPDMVSINPLVLRVHGNGKGRLKKGQGTEETRLRWVAELAKLLELKEKRAKPVQLEQVSGAEGISPQLVEKTGARGVSRQVDAKLAQVAPLSEIANALEGVGRYRLTLERRHGGRPGAGLVTRIIEAYDVGGDVADEMVKRKGQKHRYRKSIESVANDLGGDRPKGERGIEQSYSDFKSLGIERGACSRLRRKLEETKQTLRDRRKK